jgi:hypothetical protein
MPGRRVCATNGIDGAFLGELARETGGKISHVPTEDLGNGLLMCAVAKIVAVSFELPDGL